MRVTELSPEGRTHKPIAPGGVFLNLACSPARRVASTIPRPSAEKARCHEGFVMGSAERVCLWPASSLAFSASALGERGLGILCLFEFGLQFEVCVCTDAAAAAPPPPPQPPPPPPPSSSSSSSSSPPSSSSSSSWEQTAADHQADMMDHIKSRTPWRLL